MFLRTTFCTCLNYVHVRVCNTVKHKSLFLRSKKDKSMISFALKIDVKCKILSLNLKDFFLAMLNDQIR